MKANLRTWTSTSLAREVSDNLGMSGMRYFMKENCFTWKHYLWRRFWRAQKQWWMMLNCRQMITSRAVAKVALFYQLLGKWLSSYHKKCDATVDPYTLQIHPKSLISIWSSLRSHHLFLSAIFAWINTEMRLFEEFFVHCDKLRQSPLFRAHRSLIGGS